MSTSPHLPKCGISACQRCCIHERCAELHSALVGLLNVAEIAMPDTYFATDSRVKAGKKQIKKLEKLHDA